MVPLRLPSKMPVLAFSGTEQTASARDLTCLGQLLLRSATRLYRLVDAGTRTTGCRNPRIRRVGAWLRHGGPGRANLKIKVDRKYQKCKSLVDYLKTIRHIFSSLQSFAWLDIQQTDVLGGLQNLSRLNADKQIKSCPTQCRRSG
jgi:hypothetical protein